MGRGIYVTSGFNSNDGTLFLTGLAMLVFDFVIHAENQLIHINIFLWADHH